MCSKDQHMNTAGGLNQTEQTHGDEDGFIKQVGRSLEEVQEERLSKTHIEVQLNITLPASSGFHISYSEAGASPHQRRGCCLS